MAQSCLFCKRQADPRYNGVPVAIFSGRVIDENAVHEALRPVAAIVPGTSISNARNSKEIPRDPLVLNCRWRPHLFEKDPRRIVLRIRHRFDGDIRAMILRKECPALDALGRSTVLSEDGHGELHAQARAGDLELSPLYARGSRACCASHAEQDGGDELPQWLFLSPLNVCGEQGFRERGSTATTAVTDERYLTRKATTITMAIVTAAALTSIP